MIVAKLLRKEDNTVLFSDLSIADTLWARTKGLLGTKNLSESQALWIHECRSIHTCFMKYAIDCVFVNKNLEVVSVVENVKPFRVTFPRFEAQSVIELQAGLARKLNIKRGDHLYVDTADH